VVRSVLLAKAVDKMAHILGRLEQIRQEHAHPQVQPWVQNGLRMFLEITQDGLESLPKFPALHIRERTVFRPL
jgi:hypothetical protein